MLYTDPGSGMLLWQVLVAGALGGLFYVRKIFSFFRGTGRVPVSADGNEPKPQE